MEKINYIISLGCSCNVSYFIKKLSLKRFSLPFDWVFSNCKMIIDILYDNFEDFIDTKYIIGTSEHQKYHKKMFNHKNMTQQKNIEYYKRCITRFQQVINSNKKNYLYIHHIKYLEIELVMLIFFHRLMININWRQIKII